MRYFVSFLINIVCGVASAHAGSGFAGLERGPYGVGSRVIQAYDHSRSFRGRIDLISGASDEGERARPMQMLLWYPARTTGKPLTYQDYMRTEATDEVFDQPAERITALMRHRWRNASASVGTAQARRLFDQPMWAERDAAALPGKFPVLVYAPGVGGAAHESADMFEYLASHGYIVLASRSMGTFTREMNTDQEGIDTQVRDLQFLISHAHTLSQADTAHIAAIGWSWGGMANVFAAARDSRITALVSLDGTRDPEFTRTIPRARVALPWLYISRRTDTISDLNRQGIDTSFSLLNELKHADIYEVIMTPMKHTDFSSSALRFAETRHFDEYSRAEVETAYRWVSRYVLEFLNGHLKQSASGIAFLQAAPKMHGAPAHTIRIRHTPAEAAPASRAAFAAALADRGFDHAPAIYRKMVERDPSFRLSERDINLWGYQLLLRENRPRDAISMFKFGLDLNGDSANLFDSLGEAYEANREPELAIRSYRRSLELNPRNSHAVSRLGALAPDTAAGTAAGTGLPGH